MFRMAASYKSIPRRLVGGLLALVSLLVYGVTSQPSYGQVRLKMLYSFAGGADGTYPSGLIRDAAGNLYGTASGGGGGSGTIYTLDTAAHLTVLYTFTGGADGWYPIGESLIRDFAGNLYGATASGGLFGYGTVFRLDETGLITVLYSFSGRGDGGMPTGLVRDAAGKLYGTARNGGAYGYGVAFELDPDGTFTVLHDFNGLLDGGWPGHLSIDPAGNLYGATNCGGGAYCHYGFGTIFKVDALHREYRLYAFSGGADGGTPSGRLFRDVANNLYGNTWYGGKTDGDCYAEGVYGCGVLFALNPSRSFTVLHTFTHGADGWNPVGDLVRDAKGNLYGTVADRYGYYSGNGSVFKVDAAGAYTLLHGFTGGEDGATPSSGLIRDGGGNLYGTTSYGGSYGFGVIFQLHP